MVMSNGCWGVVTTGEGHATGWDNGDDVALMLRGKSRDECLLICSTVTGVPLDYLKERYKQLNNGMVRANCGNRIRGALK